MPQILALCRYDFYRGMTSGCMPRKGLGSIFSHSKLFFFSLSAYVLDLTNDGLDGANVFQASSFEPGLELEVVGCGILQCPTFYFNLCNSQVPGVAMGCKKCVTSIQFESAPSLDSNQRHLFNVSFMVSFTHAQRTSKPRAREPT